MGRLGITQVIQECCVGRCLRKLYSLRHIPLYNRKQNRSEFRLDPARQHTRLVEHVFNSKTVRSRKPGVNIRVTQGKRLLHYGQVAWQHHH